MTVGKFPKERERRGPGRGEGEGPGLSVHLNCRPLEMTVGELVVGPSVTSFRWNIGWTVLRGFKSRTE